MVCQMTVFYAAEYIDGFFFFSVGYWSTVVPEKWELTGFDVSLCQEGLINKLTAHALLLADVKLLKEDTTPSVVKGAKRIAA